MTYLQELAVKEIKNEKIRTEALKVTRGISATSNAPEALIRLIGMFETRLEQLAEMMLQDALKKDEDS